jgi:hypothetical protein
VSTALVVYCPHDDRAPVTTSTDPVMIVLHVCRACRVLATEAGLWVGDGPPVEFGDEDEPY